MDYAELHVHTFYSFQEGASSVRELLEQAKLLGYKYLAITDHDNLCGAMEFVHTARELGIHAIIGAEITLTDQSHLTLLAATREGYANLCSLITQSYIADRENPALDPVYLASHTEGLILLTGCPGHGRLPRLVAEGRQREAESLLRQYQEWFGPENVYVELQQRLVRGDVRLTRQLRALAKRMGAEAVATNGVHYHVPERQKLQDVLTAIKHHQSLEEVRLKLRPNAQCYLKPREEMAVLFRSCPEALANSLKIAERCTFDLAEDLGYEFPGFPVPEGYTELTYLRKICYEALQLRYGSGPQEIMERALARLEAECKLVAQYDLAGFFLWLHDTIKTAWEASIDLGHSDPEIPLTERPPGSERGSSVVLLIGHLIGLSQVDPVQYGLSLERFLPGDVEMASIPDIDLDFPRDVREELIRRLHEKWGWDHAALTAAISQYRMKGAVRDIGKALGLPPSDVDQLAKRVESYSAQALALEMDALPEFRDRINSPVWRDLIYLAAQLDGAPKYLMQHCGGMIFSSTPITSMVPVQPCAIPGRFMVQWDKDAIDRARFVKIDILGLATLSQAQEALHLVEERTSHYPDLSRIDFEDEDVYRMIHEADTIGVFQIESAAQRQTVGRIRPQNLVDMAMEVACVRPGVGATNGVTEFIRRRHGGPWQYDHPLEARALARTHGVILFQDQVVQLIVDVAGFSPTEADQMRRAFAQRDNERLIAGYWAKFRQGAMARGVSEEAAKKIFSKLNPHYMFPEGHAYSFGILSYKMAYLKLHYPREFYVGLLNAQPMGFYDDETIKEDARHHRISTLNPDINLSQEGCVIHNESILLGFRKVRDVGPESARTIIEARDRDGPFRSVADAMERTRLQRAPLESLVRAGAFDALISSRRNGLWEIGLRYQPAGDQLLLSLPVEHGMASLAPQSDWEILMDEYATLGMCPRGNIMAMLRPSLGKQVATSQRIVGLRDEASVIVAGRVIRRQRPLGEAVYMTLEDEFGHSPLMVFPGVYERLRMVLGESLLVVAGVLTRRDGTMNIAVQRAMPLGSSLNLPRGKNWG